MENKYKYIPGGFPYIENENVYEYENVFNYKAWGENTVIRVLHVPWDLDYSNVVIFDDIEARDTWTDQHTAAEYTLTTAVNIQADGTIKLPIPFDVLAKCNYIVVEYAYAPVSYEQPSRVSRMGYFIKDVMQTAPSTTQARVELDYWYTFIYDIDVTYLDLERGHAPMAAVTAETYLANPLENNTYLLTPDVNFSPDDRARLEQAAEWIANDGENYAVFACTGNVSSNYWGTTGTRDMQVPGVAAPKFFNTRSGYDYIAVLAEQLDSFIAQCNGARPHWLQTVQGMFFVPGKLITITGSTTWTGIDGITLYYVDTSQKYYNLLKLTKENFNYDQNYNNIAKLYTYPYCHLEITDEQGNTSTVHVENTTGNLGINAALNLVYPFIGLDVMPLGVGGASTISSKYGWTGQKDFTRGGDWYSLLKHYDIPAFIVSQSQNDRARFDRYFPNAQSTSDYTTAYDTAVQTYNTDYDNTVDNNRATVQNSYTSQNTNSYLLKENQDYTGDMFEIAANTQNASRAMNATLTGLGMYLQAQNNAISMSATMGQGLTNAALSGATGNAPGAISNIAGTMFSGIQMAAAQSNNLVYMDNTADVQNEYFSEMYGTVSSYDASYDFQTNLDQFTGASDDSIMGVNKTITNQYNGHVTGANNTNMEAQAQTNTAALLGGSGRNINPNTGAIYNDGTYTGTAVRSKTLATDTANRNRSNAIFAIDNGNKAQGVSAPAVYGTNSGSGNAATRPLGLFVNIATQSKAAIKAAGDQFLRYGYQLEQAWEPTEWQVMKHFTYWKARDVWISGRGITMEAASEAIKFILMKGTTIWDNPDEVGRVSIYDNI